METKRQELLAEAEELGLSFAKNAKTSAIEKAVETAKANAEYEPTVVTEVAEDLPIPEPAGLDEGAIRAQMEAEFEKKLADKISEITNNMEKNVATPVSGIQQSGRQRAAKVREATKLVRCIVTCRDPLKSAWEGEIISVANDVIGEQKKYIPFNVDAGYHIPQIIVNVLKSKKCTIFVNKRINGEQVKVGKEILAYGIEELEPLSQRELDELAAEQQARRSVDE